MRTSLVFLVVVMVVMVGATAPEGQREGGEGGAACRPGASDADAGDAAELSVLSGQNASGHWVAKVRLQHAAGATGGAAVQPVHLQLQRSTQRRAGPGGARAVALEATLSGSPSSRSARNSDIFNAASCPSVAPSCADSAARCPPCPAPCKCPSSCAACPVCPVCPACPVPSACHAQGLQPPACPPSGSACRAAPRLIPAGYKHHPGFGFYKFHVTPVSWFEAKATCEREGAHLVIINSQEEGQIVKNFFENFNIPATHYGIRIGINDLMEHGKFYTVLGQPLSEIGAEWCTNEPSNTGGKEHCGSILPSGLNDIPCEWAGTFVCELHE